VRGSIRLAAPCRCVPVNSNVRPQNSAVRLLMTLEHCPKCNCSLPAGHAAQECRFCGVVFAKYFAAQAQRERKTEGRSPVKELPAREPPSAAVSRKTASCPACGGVVAVGAKTCPHCGLAKPAPKPPTNVTRKHIVIAAIVLVLILVGMANQPPPMTVQEVVQICVRETGIDPTSNRAVSILDLRAIDVCLTKYGVKTKP